MKWRNNYHAAKVRIKQLKEQIAASVEVDGITLDEETHEDIKVCLNVYIYITNKCILCSQTITSEGLKFLENELEDSFKHIFWKQQLEAASKTDARTMRWHPLIIRWCLYIRHR